VRCSASWMPSPEANFSPSCDTRPTRCITAVLTLRGQSLPTEE
jgi:hypothetical protein